MNRRTVSGLLVAGGSLLVAGVVGIPALVTGLAPAFRPRREMWRPLGPLADYPVDKVTKAIISADRDAWPRSFGEQGAFVWRPSAAEIVVFSQSCTDMGCPLKYEPGSACFFCPCHGGIFAQDGKRLAGPPKTPMHRYAHRVRNSVLEVDLASIPHAA